MFLSAERDTGRGMTANLRFAVVFGLIAGAAVFSTPSAAGELRVMTNDDVTSASACIGKPVTPLCAAETVAACGIGNRKSFCDAVDYEYGDFGRWVPSDYLRLWFFRYEFVQSKRLEDGDISRSARPPDRASWQSGDIALQLWWQGCMPDEKCVMETIDDPTRPYGEGCRGLDHCTKAWNPRTYILRRKGARWTVVDIYLEPVLPETFWTPKRK